MGFFNGVKRVVKPLVDFPRWMDSENLANTTRSVWNSLKTIFVVAKPQQQESFEAAILRLGLTENDLLQRKKEFTRLVFIFILIAIPVFIYGGYLLKVGSPHGALLTFVLGLLSLAQAFRYNFWIFQIKQRRLGCSFFEWFKIGLLGFKR